MPNFCKDLSHSRDTFLGKAANLILYVNIVSMSCFTVKFPMFLDAIENKHNDAMQSFDQLILIVKQLVHRLEKS